MKKSIFKNSKFRLVLAIFAISLLSLSCGDKATDPTDVTPSNTFTLATVPATLPAENVWIITDSGSTATTADFGALEKLLNSNAAKDRKIALEFPNIEAIPAEAFSDGAAYTGVKTIVAVSGPKVVTIGEEAFRKCEALETASFPLATTIVRAAFSACIALKTVDIPLATTIGDDAFSYCYALETASFPLATTIGYVAFSDCTTLTTITIATKSTLETLKDSAFGRGNNTTVTENITVTTSAANKSKFEANDWNFKQIITE